MIANDTSVTKLVRTVKEALLTGGEVLRRGYKVKRRVRFKTATSPVTQVDIASEKKIIGLIRRRFPSHTFLAEESAFIKRGDLGPSRSGRFRWIIDPLDGTVNFIHHVPHFCVSIAVESGGCILAGGIYDPIRDELFLAQRGRGATLNGRPIHVSKEKDFKKSLFITGFPYNRKQLASDLLSTIEFFLRRGIDVRRFGSAALDLAWVACGRVGAYWEMNLSPWDMAAGLILVEEAGGKVSDFKNKPLNVDTPFETLATNGFLHRQMIRIFATS